MMKMLNRIDAVQDRRPLIRFTFGAASGVVMVLGMWLISTLSHAQDSNLGLTWQLAVTLVLLWGFLSLGTRRRRS